MSFRVLAFFLFSIAIASLSQTVSFRQYTLPSHGALWFSDPGGSQLKVGYARIQAQNRVGQYGLPFGMAICSYHQNDVLVSEVSIPASPLITSGRIYAEIAGSTNTGVALANPNNQVATINFYFTDSYGNSFGQGSTKIGANQQIAVFLSEPPFNAGVNLRGTFTFLSSLPVSATGIRGFTNERNEFLMSALPVAPVGNIPPYATGVPHIADGSGWRTDVIMVNPTEAVITGAFSLYAQNGQPLTLALNGKSASVFDYSIPAESSVVFQSGGVQSELQVGSIGVDPNSTTGTPTVFAIFGYSVNGARVTEASALDSFGQTVSVFVESMGNFGAPGSIQSGIAISNTPPAVVPTYVKFSLYQSDGTLIGRSNDISVPPHWQSSMFLSEIPGLPSIPSPFRGILRIQSSCAKFYQCGIGVTALRARFNERGEFLITTTPPIGEVFYTTSPELLFPHFAIGGGYGTEFVLFTDNGASGTLFFFDQEGNQLDPTVLAAAKH